MIFAQVRFPRKSPTLNRVCQFARNPNPVRKGRGWAKIGVLQLPRHSERSILRGRSNQAIFFWLGVLLLENTKSNPSTDSFHSGHISQTQYQQLISITLLRFK